MIENAVLVYDSENVLKSIDVTWSPLVSYCSVSM